MATIMYGRRSCLQYRLLRKVPTTTIMTMGCSKMKSSEAAAAAKSSCPFHHDESNTETTTATTTTTTTTSTTTHTSTPTANLKKFSEIPGDWKGCLPVLGLMPIFTPFVHKETGGILAEDFMRSYYEKYGKETGIARFGSTNDPAVIVFDEGYLQVSRGEGKYPSGILEGAWPITEYNNKYMNGISNPFIESGEEWRKGRMAINPYLFNIKVAQSYVPAINESANLAVKHFEEYATKGQFDRWCELASFDMFTAASLGLQLNSTGGDARGIEFADKIIGALATMSSVAQLCPYSKYDMFKFSAWDKFVDEWETGRIASTELVKLALEEGEGSGEGILHGFLKEDNDDDNTNSKNSKLKCKVSEEAATEMYLMLTLAAADTTSSLINNVLTNLAKNPTIQEKVRKEMKEELNGQDYHPDLANLEYFEQVLKETQRLTPSLPFTNVKDSVPNDLVINGFNVPAGSTFIFSHMGIANDESLAGPEPQKFDPDRFSDDRVAARKGTRAAFLDHPIACKPFGFGARMCVGSRIAKLEYMSIICRLLQDYEISLDEMTNGNKVTPVRLTKTTTIDYPCQTFHVNQL